MEISLADEKLLSAGGAHTIVLLCRNMQTGGAKESIVRFVLPPMTKEASAIPQ